MAYHVIFDPDVYPFNRACWNGKVSKHWQAEEHPVDLALVPIQKRLLVGLLQNATIPTHSSQEGGEKPNAAREGPAIKKVHPMDFSITATARGETDLVASDEKNERS